MTLGIAARRELEAYADSAGATIVDCRTSGHKWPGFLDFGTSRFVVLKYHNASHEWRVRRYCERSCQVFKWAHVDRRTRVLGDKWTIDYSEAPAYLRPTGWTGVSMAAEEKKFLRNRISRAGIDQLFDNEKGTAA